MYADRVHGKGINSYTTELFAVAMTLHKSKDWEEPVWITLDNEAVVKDVNRAIHHTMIGTKSDNQDLWKSFCITSEGREKRREGHVV